MKSWDDLNSIERSRVMDLVNSLARFIKGKPISLEDALRELTLEFEETKDKTPQDMVS